MRARLTILTAVVITGCSNGGAPAVEQSNADELNASLVATADLIPTRVHEFTPPARTAAEAIVQLSSHSVTTAAQDKLTYRGGPMLQSPEVYAVFWGPKVSNDVQQSVAGFFAAILSSSSPLEQMLQEYNINGQTIGATTFSGAVADTDAPMPAAGAALTDQMIQAESARLVDAGLVPAPNGHAILMFFFPPNLSIVQGNGSQSCNAFCAYHSSYERNAQSFYYAVIPDQASNGCEQGCGAGSPLENTYVSASHELVEAITDAAVGANNLAWYNDRGGEIGDLCVDWNGSANGYVVQSEFSNAAGGCTDRAPAGPVPTVNVSYDASTLTKAGASASFTLTSSGSGALTLETVELPIAGSGAFTAVWSASTIQAGDSATLRVTVPAGTRSQDVGFSISALDANGTHHYTPVQIHIVGAAPKIASVSPASGPSQGGTAVTVTGSNFGPGAVAALCPASGNCSKPTPVTGSYVGGTSGTQFSLTMPSAPAGSQFKIVIQNANDSHSAVAAYAFTSGASPVIDAVKPNQGPVAGNTFVTVTGSNFSSNMTVALGGVALDCNNDDNQNCLVVDDKTFILVTPANSAGPVALSVQNADGMTGELPAAFNFGLDVPPALDHIDTTSGPSAGGTYLTIFGGNFDVSATVKVGGSTATVKSVAKDFLTVVTPAHAAGHADISVTNHDGLTATLPASFNYAH